MNKKTKQGIIPLTAHPMDFTNEYKGLQRIVGLSILCSLFVTPLSVIFSVMTGSVTLLVYFIWAMASISVKIFSYFSIRIMLRENRFLFPYGAGKLENFSSFFMGLSLVPMGLYFLVVSVSGFITPTSGITYLLCQIPVALSLIITLIFILMARKLMRGSSNPSPLLVSFNASFRISVMSDSFIFLGFLAGFLLSQAGLNGISERVDPGLTFVLSVYMLLIGSPMIVRNFRSLVDLPLLEPDMLKILHVVTEFHNNYADFGMLYSRQSGKQRIIELELFFAPNVTIDEIGRIEQRMATKIGEVIPGACFRLLAKALDQQVNSTRENHWLGSV